MYDKKRNQAENCFCTGVVASVAFGFVVVIICVILMCVHLPSDQVRYNDTKIKYDMLQYRVEHIEDNNVGNELLYNDIVEFNQMLYDKKRRANNEWINWFVIQPIAELDYIELE